MATRLQTTYSPSGTGSNVNAEIYMAIRVVEWVGLLNGDVGDWLVIPGNYELVQLGVDGVGGVGGSLSWEGTLERITVPTVTATVDGWGGNPIGPILTANLPSLKAVAESPTQIRPHVTAGDANTNLNARALLRAKD